MSQAARSRKHSSYYSRFVKREAELGAICSANKQGIARPLEHYMKTNKVRWINSTHPKHDYDVAESHIGDVRKQIRMLKTLADHSRSAVTKLVRLSRREGCLLSLIRKGYFEYSHRIKLFLDRGFHERKSFYNAHFGEDWVPWRAPAGLARCLRILDSLAAMQPCRRGRQLSLK
jgi:hypothetical protein